MSSKRDQTDSFAVGGYRGSTAGFRNRFLHEGKHSAPDPLVSLSFGIEVELFYRFDFVWRDQWTLV